jgi:hypothetical protein
MVLMAKSTAPILLTGGISAANQWLGNSQPPGTAIKILVATGIAAGGLALVEEIPGMAPLAQGIAWIAFITLMFTNLDGKPSPIQNLAKMTGTK